MWPYSDSIVDTYPRDRQVQPCVYPNWDNTPRSGRRGLAVTGATPERFQRNVEDAVALLSDRAAAGAAAVGQVVERMGGGQPPRARPATRSRLAGGAEGRSDGVRREVEQGPLRIAMISYYLPSESKIGVGYQVHELANELVRRGHHVDVFSPCAPVEGALYGHVHLPLTGSLRTFRFAIVMRRQDLSSYDVLHAHGEDYWMWRRRVPMHVRTLHGSCFEEAMHIRGLGEKLRMIMLGFTEVLACDRGRPHRRHLAPDAPLDAMGAHRDPERCGCRALRAGRHAAIAGADRAVRRHLASAEAGSRTRPRVRGRGAPARARLRDCGW